MFSLDLNSSSERMNPLMNGLQLSEVTLYKVYCSFHSSSHKTPGILVGGRTSTNSKEKICGAVGIRTFAL